MADEPIRDSLCTRPPKPLTTRKAVLTTDSPMVLEVPGDPPDPDPERWFRKSFDTYSRPNRASSPIPSWWRPLGITKGNDVKYFASGPDTMEAIGQAWQRVTERTLDDPFNELPVAPFIYILGWSIADFPLFARSEESYRTFNRRWSDYPNLHQFRTATTNNLLKEANEAVVQIRAMIWDPSHLVYYTGLLPSSVYELHKQAATVPTVVNQLDNGAVIVDRRVLNWGSHHQKIVVVHDGTELVGFCGGFDITVNNESWLDIHCRIRGPAAFDLLGIFLERWLDHPKHHIIDRRKGELRGLKVPRPEPAGRQLVQIARTYPNGSTHGGLDQLSVHPEDTTFYSFSPEGERSAQEMILHAIAQARRLIYLEDQFMVSTTVCEALVEALPRIEHLILLIPTNPFRPEYRQHRKAFIERLEAAAPKKVHALHRTKPILHSKLYIIDDEVAIFGSANCNRRSLTHDSEVMAAIVDEPRNDHLDYTLAHRMRIALWANHLNMDTPEGHAELANGVAAAIHWQKPPPGAHVIPYGSDLPSQGSRSVRTMDGVTPSSGDSLKWSVCEPDGS